MKNLAGSSNQSDSWSKQSQGDNGSVKEAIEVYRKLQQKYRSAAQSAEQLRTGQEEKERLEARLSSLAENIGFQVLQRALNKSSGGKSVQADSVREINSKEVNQVAESIQNNMGDLTSVFQSKEEMEEEIRVIHKLISDDTLSKLNSLSDDSERCYMTYITARLRHLQEEAQLIDFIEEGDDVFEKIKRTISSITTYVNNHDLGYVHGLARKNEPKTDSWLNDTYKWADRFKAMTSGGAGIL